MKTVTINNVELDISDASLDVQDLNETGLFSPSLVQVNVSMYGYDFAYQTSTTYDAGGVSSRMRINAESGAYDSLLALLIGHDALIDSEDEDDQVYAAGLQIGNALDVQEHYDNYLSGIGKWKRADGIDANTETFETNG